MWCAEHTAPTRSKMSPLVPAASPAKELFMSGPPGPHSDPLSQNLPPRTPGPLGHNDAGDPNAYADLGPTEGPLGHNDHGTPHAGRPVHTPACGSVMVADAGTHDAKPPVEGWPSNLDWSQFPVIPSPPRGVNEDAQTATDVPPIDDITVEHDRRGFHLGSFAVTIRLDTNNCWLVKDKASAPLL